MAVSAPSTPAHGERLMNLKSESLAWLDNEVINSNDKNIDDPKNNQFNDFNSEKGDMFFDISNGIDSEPKDLIVNIDGKIIQY